MKNFKILLLITAVLISACGTTINKKPEVVYLKILNTKPIKPCKVVILPFKNESEEKNAGEKIAIALSSSFIQRKIDVVLPGDVKNLITGRHYFPFQSIPDTLIRFFKNNYNAGLLITGKVIKYKSYGGGSQYPEIKVWIEGIETTSGKRVFAGYITHKGDDFRKILEFGVVKSITKLTRISMDAFTKKLQEAGIKCTEKQ